MSRNPLPRLAWVVALVAVGWLAARGFSQPGGAAQAGNPDNILRLALVTDVKSLDTAIAYEVESWPLVRLMNQGLLDYGDGADLQPWLAREMPEISPDGRSFTFRIRPGIRFSNGRELVAEDFVYTLERLLDPATRSPGDGFFRNIRGARAFQKAREKDGELARETGAKRERRTAPTRVAGLQVLDSHTLRIELEAPDLSFLHVMAMPFTYAVAREQVEKWGESYYQHPIGTGPYVLTEWRRSTRLRFARNPYYHDPERPVRIDGVDVVVGPDDLLQQMMFERGELSMLAAIPDPDFIRITTGPKWKDHVVSMPTCAIRYLTLNTEIEPFRDRRVRQAMNHAVNRERLLQIIKGQGTVAKSVLPPNMPGYNPALPEYAYNPARARALLAEAGKKDGFEVDLWVSIDDSRNVKIGQAVQQDLGEVGVKVSLKVVSRSVFLESTGARRKLALALNAWYQDYPDPSNFLDVLLNGERIVNTHSNNRAFYSNPRVNALLKQAAVETDPERRFGFYQEAEKIIVDDAPWVFLYHPRVYLLRQPWLHGLKPHPVWPVRYEKLWMERS